MLIALNNLRPMILSLAIALGLILHCDDAKASEVETAIFAGGCFWCVESDFESVDGVLEAVSGFAGGKVKNPSYEQVVKGGTGHLEAVMVSFDPSRVTYEELVGMFFRSIDPTDAGGQFCDRGATYSTAIFATPGQIKVAEVGKTAAQAELGQKIVTPILPVTSFYPADAYHQDYYKQKDLVLTRFGPRSKAKAYKLYRNACGRDDRVKELWGSKAPFVGG